MTRCYICKRELDATMPGQYCSDTCKSEAWDRSFDSSSDNAYKIGFNDFVDKLEPPRTEETKKAMSEIIDEWGPLEWTCSNCKKVILSKDVSAKIDKDEKIRHLYTTCACGGYPVPTPPEKYF